MLEADPADRSPAAPVATDPAVPDDPGGVWDGPRRRLTTGLVLTIVLVAFESLAIATVMPTVERRPRGPVAVRLGVQRVLPGDPARHRHHRHPHRPSRPRRPLRRGVGALLAGAGRRRAWPRPWGCWSWPGWPRGSAPVRSPRPPTPASPGATPPCCGHGSSPCSRPRGSSLGWSVRRSPPWSSTPPRGGGSSSACCPSSAVAAAMALPALARLPGPGGHRPGRRRRLDLPGPAARPGARPRRRGGPGPGRHHGGRRAPGGRAGAGRAPAGGRRVRPRRPARHRAPAPHPPGRRGRPGHPDRVVLRRRRLRDPRRHRGAGRVDLPRRAGPHRRRPDLDRRGVDPGAPRRPGRAPAGSTAWRSP